jgi:hypothetical protein
MEATLAEAVRQLELGQVEIKSELKHIREDVETRHAQNRKDIHALRNIAQTCYDLIHKLEIKQIKQASIMGAIVAIIVEGIRLVSTILVHH